MVRRNSRRIRVRGQAESAEVKITCHEMPIENGIFGKSFTVATAVNMEIDRRRTIIQLQAIPRCRAEHGVNTVGDVEAHLPLFVAGCRPHAKHVIFEVKGRIQVIEETVSRIGRISGIGILRREPWSPLSEVEARSECHDETRIEDLPRANAIFVALKPHAVDEHRATEWTIAV